MVEKKLVVVAEVPVAFIKVKFWRVEEPVERRLAKVPRPVEVKCPPLAVVKKRLVEEAVVEKKLVVVAEVPLALPKTRDSNEPEGPETVAPERVAFEKLPPSVKLLTIEETRPESESDCLVTVGRVSARRISSRRTVVLIVGE